jgi:hypothetical protein
MSEIVPVTTARQLVRFVNLPYSLYANHPHWVPPLRRDEYRRLSGRTTPFSSTPGWISGLPRQMDAPRGELPRIEDRRHNALHTKRSPGFGFLEAETGGNRKGLSRRWSSARGSSAQSTAVRGPANPSLNESAGLLIDCFDEDPFVLMPYNPPSYPGSSKAPATGR